MRTVPVGPSYLNGTCTKGDYGGTREQGNILFSIEIVYSLGLALGLDGRNANDFWYGTEKTTSTRAAGLKTEERRKLGVGRSRCKDHT